MWCVKPTLPQVWTCTVKVGESSLCLLYQISQKICNSFQITTMCNNNTEIGRNAIMVKTSTLNFNSQNGKHNYCVMRKSKCICLYTHIILYDLHNLNEFHSNQDRLCGLVVRVLGYRSAGPGSILGITRKKKLWVWNRVHSSSWVQLRSYLMEK
jgi:hypothetical protein